MNIFIQRLGKIGYSGIHFFVRVMGINLRIVTFKMNVFSAVFRKFFIHTRKIVSFINNQISVNEVDLNSTGIIICPIIKGYFHFKNACQRFRAKVSDG